jgi:hypothetical protein
MKRRKGKETQSKGKRERAGGREAWRELEAMAKSGSFSPHASRPSPSPLFLSSTISHLLPSVLFSYHVK